MYYCANGKQHNSQLGLLYNIYDEVSVVTEAKFCQISIWVFYKVWLLLMTSNQSLSRVKVHTTLITLENYYTTMYFEAN